MAKFEIGQRVWVISGERNNFRPDGYVKEVMGGFFMLSASPGGPTYSYMFDASELSTDPADTAAEAAPADADGVVAFAKMRAWAFSWELGNRISVDELSHSTRALFREVDRMQAELATVRAALEAANRLLDTIETNTPTNDRCGYPLLMNTDEKEDGVDYNAIAFNAYVAGGLIRAHFKATDTARPASEGEGK